MSNNPVIRYLNTDLDLKSLTPFAALADFFDKRAVLLNYEQWNDGFWHACVEGINDDADEPEVNLIELLSLIESFPASLQELWIHCSLREFNIGYDCGDEPWAFNNGISAETLRRIAALEAGLRITIYPIRPDEKSTDSENG